MGLHGGSEFVIERELNPARCCGFDRSPESALWCQLGAVGCINKRDVPVIQQIERFRDDIEMPRTEGDQPQDAKVHIDVCWSREGVPCISDWPRGKRINVFPVGVQ